MNLQKLKKLYLFDAKGVWSKGLVSSFRFRLSIAYAAGALTGWPVLVRIYNLFQQKDIYIVCLFAPFLSWHAAIRSEKKAGERSWDRVLIWLIAGGVLTITALIMKNRIMLSALACACGMAFLRVGFTGESLLRVIVTGGFLLLFMVPIPGAVCENISFALRQFHAAAVANIFEPLTGVPLRAHHGVLQTQWSDYLHITEKCSGIRSLLGLSMFSLYCCAVYRHHWAGYLIMSLLGVIVAGMGNLCRLLLSCTFYFDGKSYWNTVQGHEMLSVIVMLVSCTFLGFLSGKLLLTDKNK